MSHNSKRHRYNAHYMYTQATHEQFVKYRTCQRKRRLPDEFDAIHAAIGHSIKHGPCRYYRCPYCKGYHLTSDVEDLDCFEQDLAS